MSQQDDIEKLDVDQIRMCVTALNAFEPSEEIKRCVRKLKKQYASWTDKESADDDFRKFTNWRLL